MKSKILPGGILFIIMSFVFVLFLSCNEQKAQEPSTNKKVRKKSLSQDEINVMPNCCSASCPGASCLSYVSPCNCYCSITGLPSCSGNKTIEAITEGDFEIIATSEQLSHQLAVISYLLNSTNPHAMEAHALAWNMYNLFAGNNGSITSTPALQIYMRNIKDLETIVKQNFTPAEISQMQKSNQNQLTNTNP